MMADDDITSGELGRRLSAVEVDVRGAVQALSEIQVTLARQGVKVGIMWTALATGATALITSLVSLSMMVMVAMGGLR